MPGRLPRTPDEAKRWNRLNKGDTFYPIRDWPWIQRHYAMSGKLENLGRLNYFTFLWGNGMSPDQARDEVFRADRTLDRQAVAQVNAIHARAKRNGFDSKYGYYDVGKRSYESF